MTPRTSDELAVRRADVVPVRGGGVTARYVGGPILRYGGKVRLAPQIVPRLPRGRMYLEPFP